MNGTLAYLMATTGCLVAVAGVVVAVIALRRSRRATRPATATGVDPLRDHDADALRGDPRRLRPGDIIEIRQVSYAVRGSLLLTEGEWSWREHLLETADGVRRWLSVEEDPELELVLWTDEPGATVAPGPATVDFDGRRYRSHESGQARWTATGTTGLNPTGGLRYHDYRASGGARLSFERYGDAGWEVARGEQVHRPEVMIYPQSGPEQVG
ncbi:DUF4178 domain-containing protein [Micromonospora sp. WMMD882]|uniref:DUF4178 domain-containing protein n=1 Tax=Micromonospora sp. WMMD882 TaxID=3015151 RepID=UPI00248BB471|nr:DUF4178 domain-containing protein [Micromonospora sp. WMMD882]WBB78201.1 DUF4178 domain-containing protein [Micromonospora sp. WMMD882]